MKYREKMKYILIYFLREFKLFHFMNDKFYLKIMYRIRTGKKLNLLNPQTFNEKLQWLKLNDRKNVYTTMVDKYEAKKYISNIVGDEYVIPTLGIYNNFDEINFDELPDQFVIKCTHDSGGLIIVKDKKELDMVSARKKIDKCFKKNYYYSGREWPYKNVKPRIIVEKYMDGLMYDYRFYCFDGVPKLIYVYTEEYDGMEKPEPLYCNIYDVNWIQQNYRQMCHPNNNEIKRPKEFEKMLKFASLISKKVHFLRVDFYIVDKQIYIGELTFFPGSGFSKFYPTKWDDKLGSFINL